MINSVFCLFGYVEFDPLNKANVSGLFIHEQFLECDHVMTYNAGGVIAAFILQIRNFIVFKRNMPLCLVLPMFCSNTTLGFGIGHLDNYNPLLEIPTLGFQSLPRPGCALKKAPLWDENTKSVLTLIHNAMSVDQIER